MQCNIFRRLHFYTAHAIIKPNENKGGADMIKAVIFDMYETLVTLHASPTYFGAQIAADANIPQSDFYAIWRDPDVDKNRTIGKLTLEQTVKTILQENSRYSDELFSYIIAKRIRLASAAFSHLHPNILPMLDALKAHHIKIGLISQELQIIKQTSIPFPHVDAAEVAAKLAAAISELLVEYK